MGGNKGIRELRKFESTGFRTRKHQRARKNNVRKG